MFPLNVSMCCFTANVWLFFLEEWRKIWINIASFNFLTGQVLTAPILPETPQWGVKGQCFKHTIWRRSILEEQPSQRRGWDVYPVFFFTLTWVTGLLPSHAHFTSPKSTCPWLPFQRSAPVKNLSNMHINLLSTDSLLKWLQQPGMGHIKARSPEHGCQWLKYFNISCFHTCIQGTRSEVEQLRFETGIASSGSTSYTRMLGPVYLKAGERERDLPCVCPLSKFLQ